MVKHTDYFIKKQELVNVFKEELAKEKAQLMANIQKKKLEELLEKERNKIEKRLKKKQETELKLSEKKKKLYEDLKQDDEKYQAYLESQRKYREKYKLIKLERIKQSILCEIGDEEYRIVEVKGKKMYVTSSGRFFKENGKEILGNKLPHGYIRINYVCKSWLAHRLVWEAFNGEIPEGMEIDHTNGLRHDNRLCNLRICTHKENCNNPISIEKYKKHNKEVNRDYLNKTVYQYTLEGELVGVYDSAKKAADFGFDQVSISKCCLGKQKTHKDFLWSYEK